MVRGVFLGLFVGLTMSRIEKPVFKGGKIPSNLLVFGGRGWENAGHVGYGAHARPEKQPETARAGVRRFCYLTRTT
jgi:hypothetical protein